MLRAFLTASVPCLAVRDGLRDSPMGATSVAYLDGAWSVSSSAGHELSGHVPGDLVSDLHAAGLIGNPLYEINWLLNSSLWNENAWTYSTTFDLPDSARNTVLVFDGVKMGATVSLNGEKLGQMTDQFLRYVFEMTGTKPRGNKLEVTFPGASMTCEGRWSACSGGWDWAPYTDTTQEGSRTFTKGIWKSVYVAAVEQGEAFLEHAVTHTFFRGPHAVSPLEDGKHAGFDVQVRVHLRAPTAIDDLDICAQGSWQEAEICAKAKVPAGLSNFTLELDANAEDIKLWWPAGVGAHPLYNVSIRAGKSSLHRRVGFRSFTMLTSNDTDPAVVQRADHEEGSDDHGVYFRVNGALIFSRGANMIPMEALEGWMDADAHRQLVKSAVEANFNTLRVWGGGIFLPDAFYDACDESGIFMFHDMMYAQDGHSPKASSQQDAELRHQVRRLSHHPSICIWDGCNECQVKMHTDTEIYASFVMTVVAEEDLSRAVWPSCPAKGWTKGVHKLSGRPTGTSALETPDDGRVIEIHGPYTHGTGFPATNGATKLDIFDAKIPLTVSQNDVGAKFQNQMFSEFGGSVISSFESMSATLDKEHWGLHGGMLPDNCTDDWDRVCTGPNAMSQRNYPCDNYIITYFGNVGQDLNATGEAVFKKQLYQCMIGQGLLLNQEILDFRGKNTFGLLVWQFNEIWPTGGWGSVEYGNPEFPGQVIGGRWKPLHHWYKSHLFADVLAHCGREGHCWIRNDAPKAFSGKLLLQTTAFANGTVTTACEQQVSLAAGAGTLEYLECPQLAAFDDSREHVLEAIVTDVEGELQSRNVIPLTTPEHMALKTAKVSVSAIRDLNGDLVADVKTEAVAMYVTLTTLAHGRFEDNAFLLRPPGRKVKFLVADPSPHASQDEAFEKFQASLRVEDASAYNPAPVPPAAECDFIQDTDYAVGELTGQTEADSQEQCCRSCWQTETCAAAVFVPESDPSGPACWMKTQEQVKKPNKRSNRIACVRKRAELIV